MESESPPLASPPPKADDTEVSSHTPYLSLEETWGRLNGAGGQHLGCRRTGGMAPTETGDGGLGQSVPQPDTTSETHTTSDSSARPPAEEGGAASSINPEAPNTTADALQTASILDEHHILMGTVVEKIQSAKSGLNEAFTSLLAGFEVCNVIFLIIFMRNMPVYRQ